MADLLIVGASARAAAASARRAGFTPWCADLFADADLRAMVPDAVRCPVDQYPAGLAEILRDAPDAPWIYTGGLENHPNLVREMAEARPLWGNGPNALIASRSPFTVERILREEGLPTPVVLAWDAELPSYGRWLRKLRAGSAGQGIAFADATRSPPTPAHYFQQFINGVPMSAVYVRARGDVRLLGVTEQLIGESWLNAPPFRYAGNIGPVEVSADLRHDLLKIGQVLGERCELLGLFGVDFMLHEGRPWVVEVNPRYTASIEVLELAMGVNALEHHRMAFDPEVCGTVHRAPGPTWVAKGILYASRTMVMPAYDPWEYFGLLGNEIRAAREWASIRFADIPASGDVIEEGWPILTVLAEGNTRDLCWRDLTERTERIKEFLAGRREEPPGNWYARLDDPEAG